VLATNPDKTNVIYRDLNNAYPTIVRGEGIYLFDAAGNRWIDGSGGSAAVTAIGHGVDEVVDVIAAQAKKLAYAPMHVFSTEAIEDCARLVIEEFAPNGLDRVWFVSGGSEATENAVKMALQYQRDRGFASKHIVISRWQSYHGATLAALSWSGNAGRRKPYSAAIPGSEHIPPCNPYRPWFDAAPDDFGPESAAYLERVIMQLGPENVAAFIAEPIVGATLGAVPAASGYFQAIREICDRHGVVFIADEVMSGFGRTGKKFGIDHWGVTPDLIACAKGIAGGYAPLGAVIARSEIVGEIRRRTGSFVIGHTSSGNPLSCATGAAVLRYVLQHRLIENASSTGAYFTSRLEALKEKHAMIGDVRGLGLMLGVEFVQNRATKAPFPVDLKLSKRVSEATLRRGLVSYPGSGTVDGVAGDHLLYTPPLTITPSQVDELIAILDESLAAVAADLPS
jgi:adenosylmethionine-8-amino-7-oxononanoate aminotransferase